MNQYLKICFAVLSFFAVDDGHAQEVNQPSILSLFVHTDKSVYTKNEHVWFSGYLSGESTSVLSKSTSLIIMIKDEYNRNVQQGQFFMADGLSFGCLELSDTIPPGSYRFIAYTDIVNEKMEPIAYFETPLIIKYTKSRDVILSSKLTDSTAYGQTRSFQVTARDYRGLPIKGAGVTYIYDKDEINAGFTDEHGRITLTIENYSAVTKKNMLVKVRSNGLNYLRIFLEAETAPKVNVEFYPEGEQLSTDLLNNITWVANNEFNEPLQVRGVLLQDNLPVDTVETKSSGIGKFSFVKVPNARYRLKLIEESPSFKDTLHNLPQAIGDGIALRIKNAVVNDTLAVSITSKSKRKVNVLLHRSNNISVKSKLLLQPFSTTNLKIALQEVPKGINTISITDSLNRPLAGRKFFSAFKSTVNSTIFTDRSVYKKKEQVNMKLVLKDSAGKALEGVFSIACIQKNRIYDYVTNNIEANTYLIPSLGKIPVSLTGGIYNDEEYLEDLLSFSKAAIVEQNANSASNLKSMAVKTVEFQGLVTGFNKPLKKKVKLTIMRDSVLSSIETKQDGTFFLTPESMVMPYGKKVSIFVNEKNKEGYHVQLKFPDLNLKDLEERYPRYSNLNSFGFVNEISLEGKTMLEGKNVLKEVLIKGRKDGLTADNFSTSYKGNTCGDYVAICNGLNCQLPGHNYQRKAPVNGKTYIKHIITNNVITSNIPVYYSRCTGKPKSYVFTFDGVYTTKEHYGMVNSDIDLSTGHLSTLLWSPGVMVTENGSINLSFITSNLPGNYKIVIAGFTSQGPVHIEKEIAVE